MEEDTDQLADANTERRRLGMARPRLWVYARQCTNEVSVTSPAQDRSSETQII
jgi:hypothetical protein